MSVKIREAIATIRPHWKPVVIRVVKAPNADSPCVGCALRNHFECLGEECEELLEYGYQFQEMHGMDADKGRIVRNCDIGTFDSQLSAFIEFCNARSCNECPLLPKKDRGERYACAIAWMGMKYNGGAK